MPVVLVDGINELVVAPVPTAGVPPELLAVLLAYHCHEVCPAPPTVMLLAVTFWQIVCPLVLGCVVIVTAVLTVTFTDDDVADVQPELDTITS